MFDDAFQVQHSFSQSPDVLVVLAVEAEEIGCGRRLVVSRSVQIGHLVQKETVADLRRPNGR